MRLKRIFTVTVFSVLTCLLSPLTEAADPKDLATLLSTNSCPNCDLREADLRGLNLIGADFSGALLENASLEHANLWKANFTGANLK